MADFTLAIPTVLAHEGGYANDPDDPGGETNFGISKRSYPDVDIADLTQADAEAIYQRDFWTPLLLDQFNDQGVATKVLDTAVLIGISRSVKFLQRSVQNAGGGIVVVDGAMGPHTLAAVNASSPDLFLQFYRQLLVTYYEGLVEEVPTDQKFLEGWLNRANS
jgi:lysozyme family protein